MFVLRNNVNSVALLYRPNTRQALQDVQKIKTDGIDGTNFKRVFVIIKIK
jgi:hypothetical protein